MPANSMNLTSTTSGLANWDGSSELSSTSLTQFSTLTAASANTVNNVAPGTVGQVLTSNGVSSQPTYQSIPPSGTVTSVSGTTDRITSTGGADPVLDIALTYAGQSTINTLGTVTTGVWNGTAIDETHGGTNQTTYAAGDLLYASGANTLAKLTAGSNGDTLSLAGGLPSWSIPASGGITQIVTTQFTASGTYTPTAGMKYCCVEIVGGGGGGGGAASTASRALSAAAGGAGGQYSKCYFSSITIGSSQPVTIGSGGSGGVGSGGASGGTGTETLFGLSGGIPLLETNTAPGGSGASSSKTQGYSLGSSASLVINLNSYDVRGSDGDGGIWGTNLIFSGNGGASGLGGGQTNGWKKIYPALGLPGNPGSGYGAGGSGAFSNYDISSFPVNGGAGTSGFCYITEYI